MIIDANGNRYTSASEDLRLADMKKAFRQILGQELTRAIKQAEGGRVAVNLPALEQFIDQAYFMGKDQG